MRVADLTFRQRFIAIGVIALLGFAAVIWIARDTLAEVRIGGDRYEDIIADTSLASDITPATISLGPTMLYAMEAATAVSPEVRSAALARANAAIAAYEERWKYWDANLVDLGLGLRTKLLREAKVAGDEYVAALRKDVWPALDATLTDRDTAMAAIEAVVPKFRQHRAAIEEAQVILARRLDLRASDAHALAESGERRVFWVAGGSFLLALLVGTFLLRSVLRSIVTVRDRMRVMAEQDADLGARIAVTSKDEVGELSHWVNQFLEKIAGLVRAVKKSTIQLRSTATEMAATSHEQAATVSSFGASTTEIAAATKEISATGAELTSTMAELDQVAKESSSLASGGRDSLTEMRGTMGALATSSGQISQRLSTINEKARDITGVVTTITKVADQTNLLSVNAAIEAEKAGEYGRGFLVVAREIRRLADQTAAATLDIEQTVQQMQGAVSAGVMEMDKFSEQVRRSVTEVGAVSSRLDKIIGQVQVLTDRFAHVTEGMRAQAEGKGEASAKRELENALLVGTDVVYMHGEWLHVGSGATFRIAEVREHALRGANLPLQGGRLLQAAMGLLVVAAAGRAQAGEDVSLLSKRIADYESWSGHTAGR